MKRDGENILRHTAIYLVARGLPGILSFLALPLFTRLLTPSAYGRYALVLATVNLLNALLFQWLRLALVRYLPAWREDPRGLKSTLLAAQLYLLGGLGIVALILALLPLPPSWRLAIGPCWGMLAIQAPFEMFCEYARSQLRPWFYMMLQVLRAGVATGLGALLIVAGMGWWGPLTGLAVGMLGPVIFAWRRDWIDVRLKIDRQAFSAICRYGIPLSLTVALAVVIASSDRFLIAAMRGEDAAGLYSVGYDFTTQTLTLLMMVISLAMFPIAVRAFEEHGREAAQDQMRHNASLLLAVGIPAVIGLSLLAPNVAHCFLGRSFRAAASGIIPLIALGSFLAGLKAYHFDAAFQFAHRTIHQVWIVLVAALVNLGLNLWAIPRFGINGAAAASVLAYVVSIALTILVGRRHFVLPFPMDALAHVLLASGAMAIVLWPLREYRGAFAMSAQLGIAMLIYGGVLFSFDFLGTRRAFFERLASSRLTRPDLSADIAPGAMTAIE